MKSVYVYLTERVSTVKPTEKSKAEEVLGVEIVEKIAKELDVSPSEIEFVDDESLRCILEVDGSNYMFIKEDDVDAYLVEEQENMMFSFGGFEEYIGILDKSSQEKLMTVGAYKFLRNANDIIAGVRGYLKETYNEDEDLQEEYEDEDAYVDAMGLSGNDKDAFENAMQWELDGGMDANSLFQAKNINYQDMFDEMCTGGYTVAHNGRTLSRDLFIEDIGGYQEVYEMDEGILAKCDY